MTLTPAIGNQWGVGSGDHGLGQNDTALPHVTVGNTISAAQWNNLLVTVDNCLKHEGLVNTAPTGVVVDAPVTYSAAIAAETARAYNNSGVSGSGVVSIGTTTSSTTASWGSATFTQTVTFASGNQARYFFNAGGNIALTFSRTGGSATTSNTNWTNLLAACGTIKIGYHNTTKTGGSGTTAILLNAGNGGYWAGSGSYATHFKQFETAAGHTTNYIQVEYYWSGVIQNGGYPVINIKTTLQGNFDLADGTTSVVLNVNGANVSNNTLPVNTLAPSVTGSAQTGQTLTVNIGTWTGTPTPTYAYQWQHGTTNIAGATSSTYVISGYVGETIRCVVTASNSVGSVSANSNATASY